MRKFLWLALLLSLLSSWGHFYLAKRTYQLSTGSAPTSSICHIGEHVSCDSALLSPYAKIFGISLSNFGLAFNLVLVFLLLYFLFLGSSSRWKNLAFYLSAGVALASVLMAGLSLINHLFCPICWTLYALSFVITGSLFFAFRSDLLSPLDFIKDNIKQRKFYILGAVLLFTSFFSHMSFVQAYNIKNLQENLRAAFIDWEYEETVSIEVEPLLSKGAKGSKIVIVEFADFLCPACKQAYSMLKNLLKSLPDVEFQFYAYPLDGTCNPAIGFSGSGLSCQLSKALICAEKQNKGWAVHDFIFEKQRDFISKQGNKKEVKALFEELLLKNSLSRENFEQCMKDPSTAEKLRQSARAGNKIKIQGTPSFFINGKQVLFFSPQLVKIIYNKIKNQ